MNKNVAVLTFVIAISGLFVGCKSEVSGEYVQSSTSSLRLFEESTGSLLDLKNGEVKVELESASLNPLNDSISIRLKSGEHSYLIKVQKNKIAADGSFELNETELEQPIRISGKLTTGLQECSFANLVGLEKIGVEVKIFKGFSALETPIGSFKTELKFGAEQKQAKL